MKKSCRGMSFVSDRFLMSQKLKYLVKNAKQARYWSFASFVYRLSLQAFSSDLFKILGDTIL